MPDLSPLFWLGGSPTKIDYRKKGTLILTALLEDLDLHAIYLRDSVDSVGRFCDILRSPLLAPPAETKGNHGLLVFTVCLFVFEFWGGLVGGAGFRPSTAQAKF